MGASGGCGVVTPTGALGEGVGSAMANGWGEGATGVVTAFLTGVATTLGIGGSGATLGAGGSINCDSTATGTTISTARISRPLCRAHMNPTCSKTTASAMTALRLKGAGCFAGSLDLAGKPSGGMLCELEEKSGFMCMGAYVAGLPERLDLEKQQASLTPKNPPRGADDQNQAYGQCYNCCNKGCEVRYRFCHALPSLTCVMLRKLLASLM